MCLLIYFWLRHINIDLRGAAGPSNLLPNVSKSFSLTSLNFLLKKKKSGKCMKRNPITSHWRWIKYQHTKAENERRAITWEKMTVTCGRRQRRFNKSDQFYLNYQDSKINLDIYFWTYPQWDFISAPLYFHLIGTLLSEHNSLIW